jgi:hypothetical protein
VVENPSNGRPAVAKRMRQSSAVPASGAPPARTQVVKVVICQQCGDRFAINHDLTALDPELAERQAAWLADQFVWDHIQEDKHRSSVTLPAAEELRQLTSSRGVSF